MGIGAVFVNQLVKFDEKLKEDLDKMLERAREANERRYIGTVLTCSDISWLQFLCSLFCYTVASFSHLQLKKILYTPAPCYAMLLEELVVFPDLDTSIFLQLIFESFQTLLDMLFYNLAFLVADKLMHHPGATLANFPFSFV